MEDPSPAIENRDPELSVAEPTPRRASSVPLGLTIVSLLIWFGFQTVQLILERNNLLALKANFAGAVQEAEKMRQQLQALVTKTAELANQGNPAAKAAIQELEKKGIPIQATLPSK